jgi:hypothetical protein
LDDHAKQCTFAKNRAIQGFFSLVLMSTDGNNVGYITEYKHSLIIFFIIFSQKDYICYDIVPRHHNIIRYRKGLAMIKDDFHTVCSWTQFPAKNAWKYDLFLGMHFVVGVGN